MRHSIIAAGIAALAAPVAAQSSLTEAAGSGYVAEPQVPSGKFTTALEVKPIMQAVKGSLVAVREYEGRDWVYFTQVLSWRCGLAGLRYSLNGAPMQDFEMPQCQVDTAQPNAFPDDANIYVTEPLGSVETIDVELIYDDLTRETVSFEREQVQIP